jgi:hypothetical protein
MTIKLNQVIALEKGAKAGYAGAVVDHAKQLNNAQGLFGLSRNYRPKDEDGEQLPPESTRMQTKAEDVLAATAVALTRLMDVTAMKDWGNTTAKADVVVEDRTVIEGAPVTYLLWLEKQLTDLQALVKRLPVLDPAEEWEHDPNTNAFRTRPVETVRSKKVMRTHVAYEATDHHPAQIQAWQEDVPAGTWSTVKFSGAMPAQRVKLIERRLAVLVDAVKIAREHANTTYVNDVAVGEAIFEYLLA